jgi:MFS transporter, UMF1 family
MITFFTDTLDFSSTENGIVFLSLLAGSIPGAFVAGKTVARFNPVSSNKSATVLLMLNTIVASVVLKRPDQQVAAYALAFVWGVGTGWKWTTDRLLASVLIPANQDAELMGLYLFSGQVLSWIPPLVFTAQNELGVSQSVGIGTLAIYFFLGLVALLSIGKYEDAIAQTGRWHVQNPEDNNAEQNGSLSPLTESPRESPVVTMATLDVDLR